MTRRRLFLGPILAAAALAYCSPSACAGDDDATLIQGKWRVVSAKHNGGERSKETVAAMLVSVDGARIRVHVGDKSADQAAKFTLDPAKAPKQIDFAAQARDGDRARPEADLFARYKWSGGKPVPVEGQAEGIYQLDGDRLTVCWRTTAARDLLPGGGISKESAVRPSVFQSHLYYHQYLYVLERVGPGK
jgi:uncharacterized protein (TIGR03067 family)